jgi:hypothetical protein
MVMRSGKPEAPPPGAVAPGSEDKVMHASFRVGISTANCRLGHGSNFAAYIQAY